MTAEGSVPVPITNINAKKTNRLIFFWCEFPAAAEKVPFAEEREKRLLL
jgi:hypothetical protein